MSNPHPELHLAPKLSLPRKTITEAIGWLATRGAGKTHNASVFFEELVAASLPGTAIDPTGVWWGVRSSASGERAGLPVVIFGGDHGDVPISPDGGTALADLVANGSEVPWSVIDVSGFETGAELARFMTDFTARLYYLARRPFHLFVDEADNFAPQQPFPEQRRLLGNMTKIVRMGRAKGLGCSLITQRPAGLNKNVLAMCSTLMLMRVGASASHDMDAIAAYWKYNPDKEGRDAILGTLQKLQTGEVWVYSPEFLKITERVLFRKRKTFDSSKTPEPGEELIEPKRLADVDLKAIEQHMASAIPKAKADDPKELRRRIAELEKQVAAKPAAAIAPAAPPKVERVEVPVVDAKTREVLVEGGHQLHLAEQTLEMAGQQLELVASHWNAIAEQLKRIDLVPPSAPGPRAAPPRAPAPRPREEPPPKGLPSARPEPLNASQRAVLIAIAQHAAGVARDQLSILTGYARSTRDRLLQELTRFGYVTGRGSLIVATDLGIGILGDFDPLPTGDALREYWLSELDEGGRRVLEVVANGYPDHVSREGISDSTGYARSTRDRLIQELARRKLVTSSRDGVRASDTLFGDGGSR